MLSNQLQILSIIDPEQRDSYEQALIIVENGYENLYSNCAQHILADEETITYEEGKHIVDIFSMFWAIYRSLEKIEDKTEINVNNLRFHGFDHNLETKYMNFAKFFITKYEGGRYKEISPGIDHFGDQSHALEVYERMLDVWNNCNDKNKLTKDELIQLGIATIHPNNR